jgi:hypothetical protein
MLRLCVLDFKGSWILYRPLVDFAYNNSFQATIGMTPYEALYGHKCISPLYWDEVGERQLLSPEMVQDTKEKIALIRKRMLTAQADIKVIQIRIAASLNSKFVTLCTSRCRQCGAYDVLATKASSVQGMPFQVLKRVSPLAYKVEVHPTLTGVHDVFHVSQLQKCVHDPSHVINYEPLDIQLNLTYEELPVEALDRKEQQLRTNTIPLVKILW